MPVSEARCIAEVYEVPCPHCGFRNLFQVQPQEPFLKTTAPRGMELLPVVEAVCQNKACRREIATLLGRHIIPLGDAKDLFDAGWE